MEAINEEELVEQYEIGRGATFVVSKSTWSVRGGMYVVVKNFKSDSSRNTIREISVLLSLHQMNIASFVGFTHNGLIMEFINGPSLYTSLRNRIDWQQKIGYAKQATLAISFLHCQQPSLIHGDIRSSNFLINISSRLLKLIGLEKFHTPDPLASIDNRSILWMAPELYSSSFQVFNTRQSDIFSLGMLFYEIANAGMSFDEIENNYRLILDESLPSLPNDCPSFFKSIIEACCTRNHKERPSSVEISHALNQEIEIMPKKQHDNCTVEKNLGKQLDVIPLKCESICYDSNPNQTFLSTTSTHSTTNNPSLMKSTQDSNLAFEHDYHSETHSNNASSLTPIHSEVKNSNSNSLVFPSVEVSPPSSSVLVLTEQDPVYKLSNLSTNTLPSSIVCNTLYSDSLDGYLLKTSFPEQEEANSMSITE